MTLHSDQMKYWACTSLGGCVTGFVTGSLPYLQFIALVISIAAGIRTLMMWREKRP